MTPRIVRHRWDDIPLDKVTEMASRKTLGGAELELTQAYFKKGTKVPGHAHHGEMLIYVLQGVIEVLADPDVTTLREGDLLVVPPGTVHQAEVLDDAFLLLVAGRRAPQP
jgi:quercetin dioxygenase-like cupin family protein